MVSKEGVMRRNLKFILVAMYVFLSMFVCFDANANIFGTLSTRAGVFAIGLRNLAYVLSGFGLIMFTFLAISGKINFKHLGYITLSLFMVSAVGALIDYVTDNAMDQSSSLVADHEFGENYKNAGQTGSCYSGLCK